MAELQAAPKADAQKKQVEDLRVKHGGLLAHVVIDGKLYAFRAPELEEWEEYQEALSKKTRGVAFRELAQVTCVCPENIDELKQLFARRPASPARIADAVADLAGADFELTVKKD